ncbi:hypothetical protein N9M10_02770 [Hellea sp.]|nr:hypothetical protein [Hellea sp.]
MNRQILLRVILCFVFGVSFVACDATREQIKPASEVEKEAPSLNPPIGPNQFWANCPVEMYEAGESNTGITFEITGLCPLNSQNKIELITGTNELLDGEYSKFIVMDQNFTPTNISDYFSFDKTTNSFFISAKNANKMWASLPKGKYTFSANPISEDYDFAASYEFVFEIR